MKDKSDAARAETPMSREPEGVLRERSEVTEAIKRILESAFAAKSVEEIAEQCLRIIEEVTESQISFIGEIGPDGSLHDLAIRQWRHPPRELPIHELFERVLAEGRSLISNEAEIDFDRRPAEGQPMLTSFLGTPLLIEGKPPD